MLVMVLLGRGMVPLQGICYIGVWSVSGWYGASLRIWSILGDFVYLGEEQSTLGRVTPPWKRVVLLRKGWSILEQVVLPWGEGFTVGMGSSLERDSPLLSAPRAHLIISQ